MLSAIATHNPCPQVLAPNLILSTIIKPSQVTQRDRVAALHLHALGDRTFDLLKNPEIIDELCYVAQTEANVKDIASWVGNSSTIGRISTPP